MEGTVHRIMQYPENIQAEMVTQLIPSSSLYLLNQTMNCKISVTKSLNPHKQSTNQINDRGTSSSP